MKYSSLFVAGHQGMVGSAIVRQLKANHYQDHHLLTARREALDLCDAAAVCDFFEKHKPDAVIVAAAKVGGIWANQSHPAGFLYDNLAIAQNVIHSAWKNGVKRLIFLGSSCIYPRDCAQPIKESYLLQGVLEKTNEAYALAKIVGLKLCEYYRREYGVDFFSVMPTNLYGPGDYYHLEHAHVIPSLMRKFHEAKIKELSSVTVWGSGKPRREFLHVDDLATAIYQLLHLDHIPMNWLNIGTGVDHSIAELGLMLKEVVGFQGDIVYDTSKPDGTPQKLLDISEMRALNWQPKIPLLEGLKTTYDLFVRAYHEGSIRG